MLGSEIVTRRRKWSAAEKAALLAEVEAEGGKIAVVARRHGISESLLYNWRSAWKAAASAVGESEPVEFVPIGIFDRADDESPTMLAPPEQAQRPHSPVEDRAGLIEVELPNGARIRVDAFVNETALSRVLRAIKGSM